MERWVRACLVPCLTVWLGCSEGGVRTGSLPEAATSEQPRFLLRCEQGRLNAYVIVGPSGEGDSALVDGRAVAVRLDSAPSC